MPLYMDVHRNRKGLTREALAEAHQKDLQVQKKHGVEFLSYWYNEAEAALPTKRPLRRFTVRLTAM